MTQYTGATSSAFCECRGSLGWSLKPGNSASACEQVVEEIGGQFELAVALSDFANDVGQVQTNFTNALAVAYDVDPANVTLVYYATPAAGGSASGRRRLYSTTALAVAYDVAPDATGSSSRQSRRLLQLIPGPATTVQSQVKVFASIPRISLALLSVRLRASVPGIKIQELRTMPEITTPALPGTSPVMAAKNDTAATGTNVVLYAVAGSGALLLILIAAVVLAVVLRRQSTQTGDYDDDDASNFEEGDDMGQNMDPTDYRPQNMQNTAPPAHCGDARGAFLYGGHAYNAFDYLTYQPVCFSS